MKSVAFAALGTVLALSVGRANAQGTPPQHPMHQGMEMMHDMGQATEATEPGQAAFGAIQEIVRMLQADQATNWSKVDIDALRQHLIDMDEVTLHASAKKEPIEKGLRILVTGSGRTLEAIQRMIPAHVQDMNGLYGWSMSASALPDGEVMTVTGNSASDEQKIRALGFMGVMVLGTHQMHHLAMAKGEMMH